VARALSRRSASTSLIPAAERTFAGDDPALAQCTAAWGSPSQSAINDATARFARPATGASRQQTTQRFRHGSHSMESDRPPVLTQSGIRAVTIARFFKHPSEFILRERHRTFNDRTSPRTRQAGTDRSAPAPRPSVSRASPFSLPYGPRSGPIVMTSPMEDPLGSHRRTRPGPARRG
jgi:hypothetical protein